MSQKKFISQDFSGGLDRDSHVSATPDNTYTYALNLVNRDLEQNTFVSNENSNRPCGDTIGTVVGAGYVDELNKTVYFNSDGEIYLLDNETCEAEFVASDTEFECDWGFEDCEWITPHFKTANNCNEVFVYWSSGCEYYKINLTEMLDETRKAALLSELLGTDEEDCTRKTCTYFKVFKCACAPKLSPVVYPSGGSLRAGNYQFMIRLINEDGAPSNWFGPSDMVYVGSDKNVAGEISNSYIEIGLSCLDCKFARVEIAVIETIGGITTAKVITRSGYNTDTHSYAYYGNEGDPIDITELLVKGKTYIQGQDMMLKDNRAWYYNIKPRVNLDYQRRANAAIVEGLEYEFSLEDAKKYNIKSYLRGESYGFGIVWNYKDGTHSRVFTLSPNGGGDSGGVINSGLIISGLSEQSDSQGLSIEPGTTIPSIPTETETGDEQTQSSGTISMSQTPEYKRTRNSADRTVANPHADEYGDKLKGFVENITNDLSSVCEAIDSGCGPEALAEDAFNPDGSVNCDCGDVVDAYCKAAERALHATQCNADQATIDEMGNEWLDILSSFGIANSSKKDLELDFSPSNIKEAAARIIKAVQERERAEIIPPKISVNKSGSYVASSSRGSDIKSLSGSISGTSTSSILADGLHTCKGEAVTSLDDNIIDTFQLEEKEESDIRYPSTKNCNGEYIYGDLRDQPVKHFKFPTAAEKPHFISKSIGVPSNATPDADEYADGYIRPFGIKVSNIIFPSDDELSIPLCPHNPYTIVQIERTDSNKTVMSKGLATQTFTSSNQGKSYVYTKMGVNSFERASRYIDIDGSRMDAGASEHDSFNFWSLDTAVKRPSLNIDSFRAELTLSGIGFRHGLYAQGRKPDNSLYGNRIDQRGTRQAINLSNSTSGSSADNDVTFKIYSPANSVTAPPAGGDLPLMNKYGQETLWIGGQLPTINDKSFVGDVLNHTAPISDASGHYVGLIRNLPNQYGDLVNLNYIPVLQAGNGAKEEIGGLCGDVYIGPYSFVRTHYVSNKVGNKFPISEYPGLEGKSDRSICDDPEDAIHSANGLWVPTTLPKDSDAADAKNWAGLHTPEGGITKNWTQANGVTATESDYYYPRTLTTLVTYWGEFEVNPYLRQKGDALNEQFYPEINQLYYLDSNAPDSHPWEDSYLNQFYCEVTQPSLWDKIRKGLIRTILNVIFPMIGIDNLLDITSGEAMIANIVEIPMLIAMWFLMTQLLFTNDALDRLLGIPTCKTDDEGGEDDGCIRKFFRNPSKYNWDYSRTNNIYQYFGMPDPYYTCDCDNCLNDETTNEIYYSDKQVLTSFLDAYSTVRPNNKIDIPANAGKLRKLFSIGNDFYAHTTDAIWQLRYGRVAVPTSTGEIILGTGNLLSEPQAILEDTPEGFAGIRDPNSSINTQYGYFFIDADARKLYQFAGQGGLKEISRNGMFNFFKEFLDFCEASECSDEKVPGTNFYSLGVDPRLNRLLITKSDISNSWTLSYDLEREKWISFHSYIPQAYVWDRDHMYTLDGKGFWKHDVKCEFQKFFDEGHPHIIEFANNDSDIQAFSYGSSIIDTDARICSGNEYLYGRDITFNKIGMWNSYQTTGMVDLRVRSDSNNEEEDALGKIRENTTNIEIVRENLQWRLNELQDYTADHNSPLLTRKDCNPFSDPINTDYCLDLDQQNYKNRIVFDNYLTTRIVFSNFNDVKLYTRGYLTYIDKQVN